MNYCKNEVSKRQKLSALGSPLFPFDVAQGAQLNKMKEQEKIGELISLYRIVEQERLKGISKHLLPALYRLIGYEFKADDLEPFIQRYCDDPNGVQEKEVLDIFKNRLREDIRARSFELNLKKLDHEQKGLVSSKDAMLMLKVMMANEEPGCVKSANDYLLEHSTFDYQTADLNRMVRDFWINGQMRGFANWSGED